MQRATTLRVASHAPNAAVGIGFALLAVFIAGLMLLMERATYDAWGAWIVAPILVGVSLPALSRQAAREHDPALFRLLVAALVLKLAGSLVRQYVAFDVYEGAADAAAYDAWGERLWMGFRHLDFSTGLENLSGTNFIRFFTGIVYAVVGPSRLSGFLFYSWLGFWGLFLFYRAFVIAVPEGRSRTYARLVFFMPSLLFWPSSIGKEAWMMLSLGLATLGASRLLTGRTVQGTGIAATGLWLAGIVRPHVAGLMGVALVAGAALLSPRVELRQLGPIVKGLVVVAIVAAATVMVVEADEFLKNAGIETGAGVEGRLESTAERTEQGGSRFAPSVLDSPAQAPVAFATVLFRPFLFEAHNAQAVAAAAEGTLLMLVCLVRWRWLLSTAHRLLRNAFLAFATGYVCVFILGFSSLANFGILARQRVQLFPFFLMLLCVPPSEKEEGLKGASR